VLVTSGGRVLGVTSFGPTLEGGSFQRIRCGVENSLRRHALPNRHRRRGWQSPLGQGLKQWLQLPIYFVRQIEGYLWNRSKLWKWSQTWVFAGCAHARKNSNRQVLLVDKETLDAMELRPGIIRENITTEGLNVMVWR